MTPTFYLLASHSGVLMPSQLLLHFTTQLCT